MAFDWSFLSNPLQDIGYGLTQGNNLTSSLKAAGERTAQMEQPRAQAELQQRKEQERLAAIAAQQEKVTRYAQELAKNPANKDLVDALNMGIIEPADAWKESIRRMQGPEAVRGVAMGNRLVNPMTGEVMADFSTAGGGDTDISQQPQWIIGPDGKPTLGQLGSDGRLYPTQMPDGYSVMDPRTLYSERAAGGAFGKNQGQAVFDLPQAETVAKNTIKQIDELMTHPGVKEQFGNVMGVPQTYLPAWPGTPKANFQERLGQAQGQAFLQAYEMLRGGGQITEVEGLKAERAMARLGTAQSEPEFIQALRDFKDAVNEGISKLRQQVSASPFPTAPAQPGGTRLRYNPQTGELE